MHQNEDLLKYVTLRVRQFTETVGEENFDRLASLDMKAFRVAMVALSTPIISAEEMTNEQILKEIESMPGEIGLSGHKELGGSLRPATCHNHVWRMRDVDMKYECMNCGREMSVREIDTLFHKGGAF